jgi:GGDEF domain-containing protein
MAIPPAAAAESESTALNATLTAYLASLAAIADCLGQACPEVGEPYRKRLHRLRGRLAFRATAGEVEESGVAVADQLNDFASLAARYLDQRGKEMARTIDALEQTVVLLAQRQEFYGARLRQFAKQMEITQYPTDPDHMAEVVDLQVSGLLSVVESMGREAQSLVTRMQCDLEGAEQRLAEAEIADPATGLLNRREMERQIEARRVAARNPDTPVLLRFTLSTVPPDEVSLRIGEKLTSHFRHRDLIARWSATEFMVLFDGAREIAKSRSAQAIPWLAGTYPTGDGGSLDLAVEATLVEPEGTEAHNPQEISDPATGLLNRSEMERRIEVCRTANPDAPVLLRFTLSTAPPDQVSRRIGEKLTSHFRPQDLIGRWSETEFMVLFDGAREIAKNRAAQAICWLAGTYPTSDGGNLDVAVEATLMTSADSEHETCVPQPNVDPQAGATADTPEPAGADRGHGTCVPHPSLDPQAGGTADSSEPTAADGGHGTCGPQPNVDPQAGATADSPEPTTANSGDGTCVPPPNLDPQAEPTAHSPEALETVHQ